MVQVTLGSSSSGDLMHINQSTEDLASKLARMGEVRAKLYYAVKQSPGIHFAALGRAIKLRGNGNLRHHLNRLIKEDLVKEVKDGEFARFFIVGDQGAALKLAITRFARPMPRKIGKLLLAGPMKGTELERRLGCSAPDLTYHMKHLIEHEDVKVHRDGRDREYSLANPELVKEALMASLVQMSMREEPGAPEQVLPDDSAE